MTATLNPEMTVGAFVAERPARSRVFEKLGIDYCCGGKKPLAEVCARRNLRVEDVLQLIEAADAGPEEPAVQPARMTLAELCDHIEQTHHALLRRELPRLAAMIEKVLNAHGQSYPWIQALQQVFHGLADELFSHMMKEEQILFPLVRKLEAGDPSAAPMIAAEHGPIHCMEAEHDSAGDALARMSELTVVYTPPQGACNTFRAMLDGLRELELDLHQHIHKENNILFPRAQEQARALV
ncbi:MAG TPA: iron-sulfur cluster repair di-iron protein [Candidatus Sumerlaeota bacterium]|nr:iron-sulfur cluster repair di-iron protein [Candidatus Sumerlaeota bacterium]HOR28677.1 iron-sulfur cluster repair di-iron protein [Candidatus Sumerlaeota bacterium]HPK02522.1 iron-sulfur cluster repair di-iron protein [Candidatus Sumerlaeota bacterium]